MRLRSTNLTAALGWACVVLSGAAGVAGCTRALQPAAPEGSTSCRPGGSGSRTWPQVDACADIPKGAIPAPIGTHTNAYLNAQAEKAEPSDFVIYWNEFLADTA